MDNFFLGVDIGSLNTKVVLINTEGKIKATATNRSGYNGRSVALQLLERLLRENNLHRKNIRSLVATGYGRLNFPADRVVTEITCQALGIAHLYSSARTVIDIGGQDSKIIKLLQGGQVTDFLMNDKCSAGTGRFLEVMAGALEVQLEDMGDSAVQAKANCPISSFCTVFAESEVISHIAAGVPKEEIIAGVCQSVAVRVAAMALRTGLEDEVIFTGGVARNKGVAAALEKKLGCRLRIPKEPEVTAALGAALLARKVKNNNPKV